MRRKDRQITNIEEILEIINSCKVLRIGMIDDNKPYIVPLNFGYKYENDTLEFYFHSAYEGRKIDVLNKNPNVCFEIDTNHNLIEGKVACSYGFSYSSIIGEGIVEFVENEKLKQEYLSILMKHQTGKNFEFTCEQANMVCVYKLVVNNFSCKARKL